VGWLAAAIFHWLIAGHQFPAVVTAPEDQSCAASHSITSYPSWIIRSLQYCTPSSEAKQPRRSTLTTT
jgi:hypothetical protein